MDSKKRQSRVQGSWASKSAASGKAKSPKSASVSAARQTTLAGYVVPTQKSSATSSQPLAEGSMKSFTYSEARSALRKIPEPITICQSGIHDISTGPSGLSRLELRIGLFDKETCQWMFEQLLEEIPWEERSVVIQGMSLPQPRLTAWFGDHPYTYTGLTLQPFQWSPLLNMVREQIHQATGLRFNSMLANLYRDCKDSVSWHSDDEPTLGDSPTIASVSFGDTRMFELRRKPEKRHGTVEAAASDDQDGYRYTQHIKVPLSAGTLLIMSGKSQEDWQHRVPKEYHDRGPRINLTFRNIAPCPR